MIRKTQLQKIRDYLKSQKITRVRLIDCRELEGINDAYRELFLGPKIDTLFYCSANIQEVLDVMTRIFSPNNYYIADFDNYFIGFNRSLFMQHAIPN